jgi:hypothetical protein
MCPELVEGRWSSNQTRIARRRAEEERRDMLFVDRVAMSNFLPWGSRNADVMVKTLCASNRPLLDRMLEFADDLNADDRRGRP